MLKKVSLAMSYIIYSVAYADCEISDSLKNKSCSSNYFLAKNQRQLNEYLHYGKLKDGKLLNLEIGFDIKEKEINIGTVCNVRLKHEISMRASQNGICLQGSSIFIGKQSVLFADKKAPINIIANNSIQLRKARIQTKGKINIVAKNFDPFFNEILISKNSQITSDKLTVSTPSSLMINDDSLIKSSNVILNGGNCEVSDIDDQDNDDDRNRERFCKKFKPRFTYTGTCLNNPIPVNLKISSAADKTDSMKMTYSILGMSSDFLVKWKFDDEFQSSDTVAVQSFLFPGRHLSEAVISNSSGFFRKIGIYQNVSPVKFNKGQIAIFKFNGLKKGPSKVLGLMGLKKITLIKSEHDSDLYSGEIPSDSEGIKLISIPELGYKGSFSLIKLPAISNPSQYVNTFIESIKSSLVEIGEDHFEGDEIVSSINSAISELKLKVNSLSAKDQRILADKLQANIEGVSNTITRGSNLNLKLNLLNLLIPTANAQSLSYADKFIPPRMREYTVSDIISAGSGIYLTSAGLYLILMPDIIAVDKIAGALMFYSGLKIIITEYQKRSRIIVDLFDFVGNMISFNAVAGETHTIRLAGSFVPVTANTKGALLKKSLDVTHEFNNSIIPVNESLILVNSFLNSIGMSKEIIGSIPTLTFPTNSYQSPLSSDFITDVHLLSSEYGDVSLKSVSKIGDGVAIQFNAESSQKVSLRIYYKNDDFNVHVYKDFELNVISSLPKPIIAPIIRGMDVFFGVTFTNDPPKNLNYTWDFGDEQFSSAPGNTTHKYNLPGVYTVKLTVSLRDDESRNVTVEKKIEIAPIAEINYTKDKFNVQFDATSQRNQNLEGLTYLWDFGDGKILESSSPIAQHKYANAKVYNVSLKVISNSGASNIANETIDIAAIELSYHMNLNPRGTYLYTDNQDLDFGNQDNPPWGIPFPSQYVDLSGIYSNPDLNIRPGDMIYLKVTGDYRYGRNGAETNNMLLGVFTDGTAFYHPGPDSDFVPVRTPNTLKTNTNTDIPQDFEIFADEDTALQIPAGATRIAFAVLASNPGVTADTDGDFGVWVKIKIVRSSGEVARLNQNLD